MVSFVKKIWGGIKNMIGGSLKNEIEKKTGKGTSDPTAQLIDVWKRVYVGNDFWYKNMTSVSSGSVEDIYHERFFLGGIGGHSTRYIKSFNIAKQSCREMASLILTEKFTVEIEGNDIVNAMIEKVFKDNQYFERLPIELEKMFAMGGKWERVWMGEDRAGEPMLKIDYIDADCSILTEHNNLDIQGVAFVTQKKKDKYYYTRLQLHEQLPKGEYEIRYELYKGERRDGLGQKVDLKMLYPDLEPRILITNNTKNLFNYCKPNLANNKDFNTPLGVSIYADAMDIMKTLNVMFDGFFKEFKFGTKKILVPQEFMKEVVDQNTNQTYRYFDAEDPVYEGFNIDTDEEGVKAEIKDMKIEIRSDEFIKAINCTLDLYAAEVGLSAGTFSFDGKSMKTATEVISENSKTFRTKRYHENSIKKSIEKLIASIVELAWSEGYMGIGEKDQDNYEVVINFDDSIIVDDDKTKEQELQLVQEALMPKAIYLMRNYGLTEQEANEWLSKVAEEEVEDMKRNEEFFDKQEGNEEDENPKDEEDKPNGEK